MCPVSKVEEFHGLYTLKFILKSLEPFFRNQKKAKKIEKKNFGP